MQGIRADYMERRACPIPRFIPTVVTTSKGTILQSGLAQPIDLSDTPCRCSPGELQQRARCELRYPLLGEQHLDNNGGLRRLDRSILRWSVDVPFSGGGLKFLEVMADMLEGRLNLKTLEWSVSHTLLRSFWLTQFVERRIYQPSSSETTIS
jgi:hypothetical protein